MTIAEGTLFGPYRLLEKTVQQALEQAGHAKAPDVQAIILLTDAAARGMADSCTGGDAVVQQALALDRSKQTQEFAYGRVRSAAVNRRCLWPRS